MRNLVRKCKGIGEVSVAKVAAHDDQVGGVTTRARALAMAAAAAAAAGMGRKRRKLAGSGRELQVTSTSYVQIRSRRRVVITTAKKTDVSVSASVSASPPVVSENSSSNYSSHQLSSINLPSENRCSSPSSDDQVPASSRCSSNGSSELALDKNLRSGLDLEQEEGLKFENSACIVNRRESRETTPSSYLQEKSDDDLESTRKPTPPEANSRQRSTAEKTPSEAELDEFFCAAEKAEKKRFTEKYNFDVVKEVPLEGRYEWVRLKQPRRNEDERAK